MSAPSAICTSIECSGVKKWLLPSRCERKRTPSSRDLAQLAQAENLKAARVGEHGARPTDKSVQPAHAPDGLVAGAQVEVIGIAENDLRAQRFEHVLRYGLDRSRRAHRHEDRRLDRPVRQMRSAPAALRLRLLPVMLNSRLTRRFYRACQRIRYSIRITRIGIAAHRAVSSKLVEQLCHGSSVTGNDSLRRNLAERHQHKRPLCQPGMRNLQSRLADFEIAQEQNVQVQRARSVRESRRPVAAKLLLDGQQPIEQFARLQLRFQRHHRVHKPRLRGKAHRRGGVERRPAHDTCPAIPAAAPPPPASPPARPPSWPGSRPSRCRPSAYLQDYRGDRSPLVQSGRQMRRQPSIC